MSDRELEEAIAKDAARAIDEYCRREADTGIGAYYDRVGNALARATRNRYRRTAQLLLTCGDPANTRIIDVGCGDGSDLEHFARSGWPEPLMTGVEIFEPSLERARRRLPGATLLVANAARLPFPDDSFDAALQTTVLSSIVDPRVRLAAAGEMFRVTRPGGLVISWDIRSGGRSPNLAGIDRDEIRRLFSPYSDNFTVERTTLALEIASRVPGWIARMLERLPFLLDHYAAYARKP